MALIYPTAIAGISALLGIGYTYTRLNFIHADSLTTAKAAGLQQGRTETLTKLLRFGPRRLRRMCLEAGVRFSPSNRSDLDTDSIFESEEGDEMQDEDEEEVEERVLYEGLVREMTEQLKAELRSTLRPEVVDAVRIHLQTEIIQDELQMVDLEVSARELVRKEFQGDLRLRNEVRGEIKKDIRREFERSGKERELVAEAIQDLRAEVRERLRRDLREEARDDLKREGTLRHEAKRELRKELTWDLESEERETLKSELKDEVKRDLRRELEAPDKADLLSELRDVSAEAILRVGTSVATTKRR